MADSIPKLRRLLNEANDRIRELEARPPVEVEKVVYRDVPVEKPVDRVVYKEIEKVVEKPVYIDKIVEKVIEKPVDRVVYKEIDKIVTVPGPVVHTPREVVTIERVVYQDNPDHIEAIRKLQEKLCQYTSQLDS